MRNAYFVYSPEQLGYKFSDDHPFNHKRLTLTMDLLKSIGALHEDDIIPARMATDEELLLAHDAAYIDIVKKAGHGQLSPAQCENYGIGTEDTPVFQNMHEASALLVGGTLTAVECVMEGKSKHALNLAGGLHHGFRGRASGFCIYNDSNVAIKYLQKKYNARVLYVDTDAHHGDGVQWGFYDDPNVCTLSIHETGRYLFPGTGAVTERGNGEGYGTSFNFPIDAFTEDESFLEIYEQSMRDIFEYFKPDVVITQNGADAHYFDPLTHLYGTMNMYQYIPKLARELANEYCGGKWIGVGGGGYDIWRVVPRAWSYVWLAMSDISYPTGNISDEWLNKYQQEAPVQLVPTWDDPQNLYEPIPRTAEIQEKNAQMMKKALHVIHKNNS
ncbi:MAG: acetoin utilization protein AcuC [Caryophanon sp.]|nr:acetoin utilization protein AcuC [Caryophanon sp.]